MDCVMVFRAAIEREDTDMPEFKAIASALTGALLASFLMLGSVQVIAQTADQAPAPAEAPKRQAKKAAAGLEARHRDCLAFIQRHGLSCDPWEVPTCGYDIGYVRPLSCVAP